MTNKNNNSTANNNINNVNTNKSPQIDDGVVGPDPSLTKPVDNESLMFAPIIGGWTNPEEAMNGLREQGFILPGDPGCDDTLYGH